MYVMISCLVFFVMMFFVVVYCGKNLLQWGGCYVKDESFSAKGPFRKNKFMKKHFYNDTEELEIIPILFMGALGLAISLVAAFVWPLFIIIVGATVALKGMRIFFRIKRKLSWLTGYTHEHPDNIEHSKKTFDGPEV